MTTRYAVFCGDPLSPRRVDPVYAAESEVAARVGFEPVVIDHDELDVRADVSTALRRIPMGSRGRSVYRGWMLKSASYALLHDGLSARGLSPMTSPGAYEMSHHAPLSYPALSEWLPEMVFVPPGDARDPDVLRQRLAIFGGGPVILKDWVKSQASGYWSEACFIPDSSRIADVMRVIERFLSLQGDSLVGGLVLKGFIPLEQAGDAPFECRAFLLDGDVVGCWPRSQGDGEHGSPPSSMVKAVADRLPGLFASADFGLGRDGEWRLLEIGDGQVSGLPHPDMAEALYEALWAAMQK